MTALHIPPSTKSACTKSTRSPPAPGLDPQSIDEAFHGASTAPGLRSRTGIAREDRTSLAPIG